MAGYVYLGQTFIGSSTTKTLNITKLRADGKQIMLAPGPMYRNKYGTTVSICDTWDQYCNYGTNKVVCYGQNPETGTWGGAVWISGTSMAMSYDLGMCQTYFRTKELGEIFDSRNNAVDGYWYNNHLLTGASINNNGTLVSYADFNDWRLPTAAELLDIIWGGGSIVTGIAERSGATVNGVSGVFSVYITVSKTMPYATGGTVHGILVFPDNATITGANVTSNASLVSKASAMKTDYNANGTTPVLLTEAQLNAFIAQKCTFIPCCGRGWPSSYPNGAEYYDMTWQPGVYTSPWNFSSADRSMYPTTYFYKSSGKIYGTVGSFDAGFGILSRSDSNAPYDKSASETDYFCGNHNPVWLVRDI